jgi:hypothetical protein
MSLTGGIGCTICKGVFFWAVQYGSYEEAVEAGQKHADAVHGVKEVKLVECDVCGRKFRDCPDATAMQQGAHHWQQVHAR